MTQVSGTRLSAGAVIVRGSAPGIRFLLLRAFNHWDFPKGMVEAGESPFEAALREIEEETTIANPDFAWGRDFVETGPYSRGKVARYYLARSEEAEVDLPVNPELGRPEHSEFRWVSFEQALSLASPRLRPVVRWAAGIVGVTGPGDVGPPTDEG